MGHCKSPAVPNKPRPDFPLYIHGPKDQPQRCRWAKKVRGKPHYFGKYTDDPKGAEALKLWLDQKDELLAGRTPRAKREGLTIAELCDRYLQAKEKRHDAGELSTHSFGDYKETCDRIVAHFGRQRPVCDLLPEDFEALRAAIAKRWGPVALGNEIQRIRMVFKFARDNKLIAEEVTYGSEFKRPSKKVLRLARAEKGAKLFDAADIRRLTDGADMQLKAMILLGINCGFGNNDVGTLPLHALDLDGGWVNYHRPKTGINRRCPLWPETVTALRAVLAKRPLARTDEAEKFVFITKYGAPWAKESYDNPVTKEFRKLLGELKIYRPGLGFYTLRHTFQTIGDESRDFPAVSSIMGHATDSMADRYRERMTDERLQAVVEYVHNWLFPNSAKQPKATPLARAASRREANREPVAAGPQLKIVG